MKSSVAGPTIIVTPISMMMIEMSDKPLPLFGVGLLLATKGTVLSLLGVMSVDDSSEGERAAEAVAEADALGERLGGAMVAVRPAFALAVAPFVAVGLGVLTTFWQFTLSNSNEPLQPFGTLAVAGLLRSTGAVTSAE